MTGFTLTVASVAVGLSIGAVTTVGVTLAVDSHDAPPAQSTPGSHDPTGTYLVDYGDRCVHGHCLPCDSAQGCINKLPW